MPESSEAGTHPDWFVTTHWSVVHSAGGDTAGAQEALEKLCVTYWYPLYAYIRRKGHDEHESQDLTQSFFASLLERKDLVGLNPARGKFRAFLLAAMNHFLAKEWRKAGTLKRGGHQAMLSLDTTMGEQKYGRVTEGSPERIFDRHWAETVLETAARRLRDEFRQQGREEVFNSLNVFLSAPAGAGDYSGLSSRLQMSEAAIAKNVERMRRRYRDLVRGEIAQTVSTAAELEEEMRYLLEVLA